MEHVSFNILRISLTFNSSKISFIAFIVSGDKFVLIRTARVIYVRDKMFLAFHPILNTVLLQIFSNKYIQLNNFDPFIDRINLDWFLWEWSKKNFFKEKNSKWPIFQNCHFSKSPILENFLRKFHRSVLRLVGLIDAKAINVAQPIWLWGCLT